MNLNKNKNMEKFTNIEKKEKKITQPENKFTGKDINIVEYKDWDIIIGKDPVTAQLCRCYEEYNKGVVGVQGVTREQIKKYCTLDVTDLNGRAMNCHSILEKPTEEQIMSLYAILGRLVLPPETFTLLEDGLAKCKEGEEFYLTEAMSDLAKQGKLLAYDFDGTRYDMGDK
jgi:UTP--glucose-1-phosphate uridylyltransferase